MYVSVWMKDEAHLLGVLGLFEYNEVTVRPPYYIKSGTYPFQLKTTFGQDLDSVDESIIKRQK